VSLTREREEAPMVLRCVRAANHETGPHGHVRTNGICRPMQKPLECEEAQWVEGLPHSFPVTWSNFPPSKHSATHAWTTAKATTNERRSICAVVGFFAPAFSCPKMLVQLCLYVCGVAAAGDPSIGTQNGHLMGAYLLSFLFLSLCCRPCRDIQITHHISLQSSCTRVMYLGFGRHGWHK
jgi:hypothetical protein